MKKTTTIVYLVVLFVVYKVLFTPNKVSNWLFITNLKSDSAFYALMNQPNGKLFRGMPEDKKHVFQPIPKIIHQIWNDEIIPMEFVEDVQGLARDNPSPEWKYYFWTKDTGLEFIKNNFGPLLEIATRSSDIMRSNILRYLVIYKYGGVYFDLDTVSVKPLKTFVESHTCSLALEPAENYFYYSLTTDFILSNSNYFADQITFSLSTYYN